jgi:hypothetical protein
VTAQNIDDVAHHLESLAQQTGLAVQGTPEKITMAGLPGLRFRFTKTGSASTRVFAFNGTTEYVVDCQYTAGMAAQVGRACDQVTGSFQVSRVVPGAAAPPLQTSCGWLGRTPSLAGPRHLQDNSPLPSSGLII